LSKRSVKQLGELKGKDDIEIIGTLEDMKFDKEGNFL